MNLSSDQQTALDTILDFLTDPTEQEMVLGGPAGTGKTFLTGVILKEARKHAPMMKLLLNNKYELNIVLTSSTNKAAKVLQDATGEEAKTIHKLLSLRVYNNYQTGKTSLKRDIDSEVIQNTLIVIDEASMINKDLLDIIRKLTMNCKVLYIGDPYQLAPVFENTAPVFNEIKKQIYLTTIQRQAAGSPIIQFSQLFRDALDGDPFPVIQTYGKEIQHVSSQDFQNKIDFEFKNMFDENAARTVAWTNARVHELNSYIRHITGHNKNYTIGERLLTNKPIFNSTGGVAFNTDDIAEITQITPDTLEDINGWKIELENRVTVFQAYNQAEVLHQIRTEAKLAKQTGIWSRYFTLKDAFADLRPIFACTCNKAQGSTYGTVFIDLNDIAKCTKDSDIIRMLYTSITRAKNSVVMTGFLPARLYE